jgi:hypothetical protein
VRLATTVRPRFATTGTRPALSAVTWTRSTPERSTARWLVSTTRGFAASAACATTTAIRAATIEALPGTPPTPGSMSRTPG